MNLMDRVEQRQQKKKLPKFRTGDTVRVHTKILEGDKERIQIFEGLVIKKRGSLINESITVRKVSYGVGVERVFPIHSPMIDKIEIKQHGQVRRSKLYYLRDLTGRAARIEEKKLEEQIISEDLEAAPVVEEETKAAK